MSTVTSLVPLAPSGLIVGAVLAAALIDARTGRIPNALTLPLLPLGLALHGVAHGAAGLAGALVATLLSGIVPWALFRATNGRAIGGGDVKLFAGLGALGGAATGLEIEFLAFTLLSVFALCRLAYQGVLLRVLANAAALVLNPVLPACFRRRVASEALTEIRMGPSIAAAALLVVAWSHAGASPP